MRYLLSVEAQEYFAESSKEYPLIAGVQASKELTPLDEIPAPDIDLADLGDGRGRVGPELSEQGVRGGRSCAQSKYGLVTTPLGMYGPESRSLTAPSGSSKRYVNIASFQSTSPSTAVAYGSSSSLEGCERRPDSGSNGPWTR